MGRNATTWGPGENPTAGRPKGCFSGRHKALNALDAMLAKEKNIAALSKAFQAKFAANPVAFYERYVVPLLPKELKLEHSGEVKTQASEAVINALTKYSEALDAATAGNGKAVRGKRPAK